ncbi:hypothetical protein, partial [Endozoicomonas sp. ONNA2]|uniref:hypothetical protein n=1 Tax=Endozoicomonas sp. ONNA2 TaxID=2828741 RepID=UPI0021483C62
SDPHNPIVVRYQAALRSDCPEESMRRLFCMNVTLPEYRYFTSSGCCETLQHWLGRWGFALARGPLRQHSCRLS